MEWKPGKIPLEIAWPIEAEAPIPFSLLIRAVERSKNSSQVWSTLEKTLEQESPHWIRSQRKPLKLEQALDLIGTPTSHMDYIAECTIRCLEDNVIPVLITPHQKLSSEPETKGNDPIEVLFERTNVAGTPLGAEELMYSILKSTLPEVHEFVNNLSRRIMSPSRLVVLTARVVKAKLDDASFQKTPDKDKNPPSLPPVPNVREFRRLVSGVSGSEFPEEMKTYLTRTRMEQILDKTLQILSLDPSDDKDFGLPMSMVSTLAHSCPELLLLLFVWIDRHMNSNGLIVIEKEQRRVILAMVTTLRWFSKDVKESVRRLWNKVDDTEFWKPSMLHELLLDEHSNQLLIPPMPPTVLEESIHQTCPGEAGWDSWNQDQWQRTNFSSFENSVPEAARKWYARLVARNTNGVEPHDWQLLAWKHMLHVLFNYQEVLIYAQRRSLIKWFPDYDRSRPDQLEDFSCPWDYDHILPRNYVHSKWYMPPLISYLHGTIGNLRVWPMELNRSDQAGMPDEKLERSKDNAFEVNYGLNSQEARMKASLIDEENWQFWKSVSPGTGKIPEGYLAFNQPYVQCRQALVNAIVDRCLSIYEAWYSDLQIDKVF